jgi:hypothetical protein
MDDRRLQWKQRSPAGKTVRSLLQADFNLGEQRRPGG